MSDAPTASLGTRVPRKAKNVLDRLVGSRAMTQAGMEWLICSTDPMHDDRVRMPGYPDMNTVNSVVQTFTTTASIQAPSGQTAPWDLHVPFVPVSPSIAAPSSPSTGLQAYTMAPDGTITNTAPNAPLYAGWNALVVPTSGQDWYVTATGVTSSPVIALPLKYASGHFRVIGAGIEAVNTTAELYKGGSVTCYRAPSVEQDTFVKFATNPKVFCPMQVVSLPPSTQAEAATYTDSRTWAAEDGVYMVNTQSDMENPFRQMVTAEVMAHKALDSTTMQAYANASTNVVVFSSIQNVTGSAGTSCAQPIPFDTVGFVMAGLNPNSTVQLTVRYYIERIPATSEPDLLSMAQCPPAHDAVALEIYSRCLGEMPVAVPVSENPLGEWFSSILDSIKSVAPKLGNIVSGVGRAISEIGGEQPPVQSNATPIKNQSNAQKKATKKAAQKGAPPSYEQSQKAAKRKAKRARKRAANS